MSDAPARFGRLPRGAPPSGYAAFLTDLKDRIRQAQVRTALALNRDLVNLYLAIGQRILGQQQRQGWGQSVVERLSVDLRREFPQMRGFSARNLWDMRRLFESVRESRILRQLVAEIPWGHNLVLLNKVKVPEMRAWYIRQAIENGWSRNILALQVENQLYHRAGKAPTNFKRTLPEPQSDLAQAALKDPYIFDFLTTGDEAVEAAVERELLAHVTQFLLELGAGFAFVGRQVHLEVGDEDYYLDLLFYHARLHCYVVLELKAGPFKPEHVGKMNFYLSAVDDLLRAEGDQPSIGLILCKEKTRVRVEYALRDIAKPIGVATWQTRIVESLPATLRGALPSVEELEAELADDAKERNSSAAPTPKGRGERNTSRPRVPKSRRVRR